MPLPIISWPIPEIPVSSEDIPANICVVDTAVSASNGVGAGLTAFIFALALVVS